ncbi:hypothetical protein BGZ98_003399 [Dissophora globulifera]|nr:hypothetical protein BGZ98_003399 [Dissophora globulifera]
MNPNTSCPPSPTSTAAAAMAAAATTAPSSSAEDDVNSTSTQPSKNDPVHAARLMSLANYVRHILSLTAGNPNAQSSQIPTKQQSSQPQSYSKQEHVRTHESQSSGPGPIKSDSNRRHRYSPEYRRQFLGRRHQQPEQRPPPSEMSSMTASRSQYDHGYRHEDSSFDHRIEHHRSPSQFHPHSHSHSHSSPQRSHFAHHSQQPNPTSVWVAQTQAATRNLSALIKIPHPNLTLTLALIYVDRLKAKYPEAKGEPGCSHRLFLVAYIIAAKYRCSVELSPPVTRDGSENADGERDAGSSGVAAMQDRDSFDSFEQSLEARLNAELIFSNHAWVRLLNLGLFYRQSTATPSSQASHDSTMSPSSSSSSSPASPAVDAAPMTRLQPHAQPQNPSLSSIINPSSAPAAMLQVEDLDRMEAEFLTFLNFDLATMSHDLETCWNLLVGRNEVSSR